MPTFLSKVFRSKDAAGGSKKNAQQAEISAAPTKPRWEDAWQRNEVQPEEVQELLKGCTQEIKSRALDMPFLLLPFRPASDPSALRTFIRNFFNPRQERSGALRGEELAQELRLSEPMVLCSVVKWCWSRLPGGVVTWEAYELFKVGEQDSNMARDSFATFIPISVDSDARAAIIFDFFDLMAAIAAHGKVNGMGARKLSRLAGWWAFEHSDQGNGFDGGYKSWANAADATSHLFFAYLRSLSPDSVRGTNGIATLPISLQTVLQATEYPPETPTLMQSLTTKVVMIVDSVSPTPFALLRRARHFEYRDDDRALQAFASYDDPIQALTDECRRVLKCISSTNQSTISTSKASTSLPDASWSRFEDIGFSGLMDESDHDEDETEAAVMVRHRRSPEGLSSTARSRTHDLGRPTTPSWADFLSSGFVDEPGNSGPAPLLLPPDKVLPPIDTSRVRSSQSNRRMAEREVNLEPGELASINKMDLDDCFWWVWMTSLAGEETTIRKSVFGRCAVVETEIKGGRWLIVEEKVKGAVIVPEEGAYVAEKKSRFGFSKRARLTRRKSTSKKNPGPPTTEDNARIRNGMTQPSKTSIGPDQHARIQQAAALLQQRQKQQENDTITRRARNQDQMSQRTNSVFTLQPVIMSEAMPAMKWANKFDKDAIREAYLSDNSAGKGRTNGTSTPATNGAASSNAYGYGSTSNGRPSLPRAESSGDRALPALPQDSPAITQSPTPPPLPGTPGLDVKPLNVYSTEAAQVPLPSPSIPVERKPMQAPALALAPAPVPEAPRVSSPEPAFQEQAQKKGLQSTGSSPEHTGKPNKLKKRSAGGNGFKKFFGRSKNLAERGERSSSPVPDSAPAEALKPERPGVGRRLSMLRNKKSPLNPDRTASPEPDHKLTPDPSAVPTPIASPRTDTTNPFQRPQHPNASAVSATEERAAAHAFSSFDQGPLQDVPAFAPSDDDVSRPDTPEQRSSGMAAITPDVPFQKSGRNDSTHSIEADPEVAARDRWAQIRRNAAERVAAKTSEEQTRTSQAASADDGETSGEETIESRVARIKARVAELTGNMEAQNRPA